MAKETVASLTDKFDSMQEQLAMIANAVTSQAPAPEATPTEQVAAAAAPPPVAGDGQAWLHEEVRNVQTGAVSQGKRIGYVTRKAGSLVFIPTDGDGSYKPSEKNQHGIRGARTLTMPLLKMAREGSLDDLISEAEAA